MLADCDARVRYGPPLLPGAPGAVRQGVMVERPAEEIGELAACSFQDDDPQRLTIPRVRKRSVHDASLVIHQASLGPTGAHWLGDPPNLSCKDRTRQHPVDG
jgi:hypothetical protein